jgi:hypothetical protein
MSAMTEEGAMSFAETWMNGNRNYVAENIYNKRDLAMVVLALIELGKPSEGIELLKRMCER